MAGKRRKSAKIKHLYILRTTQVRPPEELKRGCVLEAESIVEIDYNYESVNKLASGETVDFKVNEEQAAILIQNNQAIPCRRDGKDGDWYAVDIFGDKIPEAIQIKQPGKKKKGKNENGGGI